MGLGVSARQYVPTRKRRHAAHRGAGGLLREMTRDMPQRLLIINIAGLSAASIGPLTPHLRDLADSGSGAIPVQPPVPALTSTSQATLLTGTLPAQHGIVSNGWYFRDLALILNWQRSANLMVGEPIWEAARLKRPGLRCANLFWRYATHSSCDVSVVERPTYWAD
ncbi:MAG: alkaline phosphatase family protein, partial [Planctomycetes bacterium]|nr:alkaline phosphatase family protein [Planctomycetota bacterium]